MVGQATEKLESNGYDNCSSTVNINDNHVTNLIQIAVESNETSQPNGIIYNKFRDNETSDLTDSKSTHEDLCTNWNSPYSDYGYESIDSPLSFYDNDTYSNWNQNVSELFPSLI